MVNYSKLTLTGHSLGATCAVVAAKKDSRIKALYMFDLWNQLHSDEINVMKTMKLSIPLGCISSETFNQTVLKRMQFDNWASIVNLFKLCTNPNKENIIIKGIGHVDQSDLAQLMPLELAL